MEESVLSELNMDVEMLNEGVDHLIEWTDKQPHLPHIKDVNLLKSFIIGSKSVDNAKLRLDKFLSDRNKYPKLFSNRDPTLIEWHRTEIMCVLPELTSDNFKILMVQVPYLKEHIRIFDLEIAMRVKMMVLDYQMKEEPHISGICLVGDCKGVSSKMIINYTSLLIVSAFSAFEKGYPLRVKKMIWFNAPFIVSVFFNNFFKHFLSDKLRRRMFVHSEDHSIVNNYIPLDLLPQDYGGTKPSIQQLWENLQRELINSRDWFLNEGSLKSDESKRL